MRVTVVLLGDGAGPAGVEGIRAASRLEGWQRAEGDVIAFFDTRYRAGEEWVKAAGRAPVVGGYVLPDEGYGWSGWLYYVVEYGWKPRLAAGNVSYRRAEVSGIEELDPGAGVHDSGMDVQLASPPTFGEYLRERYWFSRRWGARYVPKGAALLRIALPLLVLARTPWWRKPATLPGVLLVGMVMAWGEWKGSWFGASGKVNAG